LDTAQLAEEDIGSLASILPAGMPSIIPLLLLHAGLLTLAFQPSYHRHRQQRRPPFITLSASTSDKPLVAEGIDIQCPPPGIPTPLAQGCLLVAKPWEYNHFTSKSCLFLYKYDPETGSRGVVLERPTAFTLSELAPPFSSSVFSNHTVFLGGEQGGDMAVLLHPYGQIPGARSVGGGLFYGGLKGAEAMLKEQEGEFVLGVVYSFNNSSPILLPSPLPSSPPPPSFPPFFLSPIPPSPLHPPDGTADHGLDPNRFKWWFNYMSWGPGQLEEQIANGSWDVMEGGKEGGEGVAGAVLRQGIALERELWKTLRRHYLPRETGYDENGEEE